jgi:hypothetical protein
MALLSTELECQAEWRRQVVLEYPDDQRNSEAAELWKDLRKRFATSKVETIRWYIT